MSHVGRGVRRHVAGHLDQPRADRHRPGRPLRARRRRHRPIRRVRPGREGLRPSGRRRPARRRAGGVFRPESARRGPRLGRRTRARVDPGAVRCGMASAERVRRSCCLRSPGRVEGGAGCAGPCHAAPARGASGPSADRVAGPCASRVAEPGDAAATAPADVGRRGRGYPGVSGQVRAATAPRC